MVCSTSCPTLPLSLLTWTLPFLTERSTGPFCTRSANVFTDGIVALALTLVTSDVLSNMSASGMNAMISTVSDLGDSRNLSMSLPFKLRVGDSLLRETVPFLLGDDVLVLGDNVLVLGDSLLFETVPFLLGDDVLGEILLLLLGETVPVLRLRPLL